MNDMNAAVDRMRGKTVSSVGIFTVDAVRDYLAGTRTCADGVTQLDIKGVNCLYYELQIGGFICLRPSGTEPKLKIYYSVRAKDAERAAKELAELKENFAAMLNE